MEIIIDAEDTVVGRMATYAAKQALMGNKISVLNAEKAIVTGKKKVLQEVMLTKKNKGGSAQKGPYISRSPEKIVKRSIRGMLPWKKTRGKEAFKLIKCYVGIPEKFASREKVSIKRRLSPPYLTVAQISKLM